mgnify:CR=1 FL=1
MRTPSTPENELCGFALFMCENAHPHTFLRNFASHQIPYSMPALGKILIIDDNEDVLFALHLLLEPYAEKVKVMRSPDRIVHFIIDFRPDIVLLDMNFTRDTVSGQEGMDCLQEILKLDRHAVVVMMTAYADTDKAVQAIKAGATDFVSKPWENDKLLATLHAAMKLRRSQTEVGRLEERVEALSAERETPQPLLIGESEGMRNIVSTIGRLREADVNVLLLGENGTGKDVVARYLLAHSSRAAEPFVTIDVGAVPETLFESELFGYEKGAFTDARKEKKGRLELAHGGTLFLDEVGNLSPAAQSKLLTALEKRRIVRLGGTREIPIDVRLICATNADLHAQVTEGTFRQDLFYRINTIQIEIPPLRSRREDIPLFIDYFLKKYIALYKRNGLTLHPQAAAKLEAYDWPGNIRELQHTIEKAVILAEKNMIRACDLFIRPGKAVSFTEVPNLSDVERQAIEAAITQNDGNLTAAAEQLGVSRQTLYNKLKRFNL